MNVDLEKPLLLNGKQFILADAHYLPFKDNAFEHCTCFHVLEHVDNPYKVLKELIRVCKHIKIRVPHRFSFYAKRPKHKHYFNESWFYSVLRKIPNIYFNIFTTIDDKRKIWYFPLEVRVEIFKVK